MPLPPPYESYNGVVPQASIRAVNVGVASGPFLGPNPRRIKLTLLRPPANSYTLTTANPAVAGVGVVVGPGNDYLVLSAEDFGDFLTKALFAISPAGAQTVRVIELEVP